MSIKVVIRNLLDKTFGLRELKELLREINTKIDGNTLNVQGHWKL